MPVSVASSGIQSGSVGTEYVLASGTGGTFQLLSDLTNMANGDLITFRVKVELFSGQSTKQMWEATYNHAVGPAIPIVISPPFPAPVRYVATMIQLSGTSRAIPWAIYSY